MAQEIRHLPGRQGFEAAVRLLHAVHQVGGEGVPEGVQALLFDPRRLQDAVVPFPEIQRAGIPEPLCGLSIPFCFLFGVSMPSFWVGFLLMYLFGVKLKLLPGMGSGDFKHIILPSLALAFWMYSMYIRRVRGSHAVGDEQRLPQWRLGLGLQKRRVILRQILPNSLLSVISIAMGGLWATR